MVNLQCVGLLKLKIKGDKEKCYRLELDYINM